MNSSHHSKNFSLGLPLGLLIYISQLSLLISTWLSQKQLKLNRFKIKDVTCFFSLKTWSLSTVPGGHSPRSEPVSFLIISGQFSIASHRDQAISFPPKPHMYSDPHVNFFSLSQPHYDWIEEQLWSCPTLFPKLPNTMWEGLQWHSCTHTDLKPFRGTPCGSLWPALDLRRVISPQLCVSSLMNFLLDTSRSYWLWPSQIFWPHL